VSTSPVSAQKPRRRVWRVLRTVVLTLVLAYGGVFIVLLALERWLVFRPTSYTDQWLDPPAAIRAEDLWLSLEGGVKIHAWWCPPAGWEPSHGALLYAHGNAGNLSHRAEGVRRWQERFAYAVLIFDYPGYGRSTGKPSETGCYAAADAVYDWLLREKDVPAEQIVLYGGSLGGGVAIDLAVRRPYRALVLVNTFTSIPDMAARLYPWLPARRFIRNRFENRAKIGKTAGRVFIAHGTADRMIPFSMGEELYAAAPEPKRFFPLEGFDHNNAPGPDFYVAMKDFLAEVAASRTGAGQ
jgi:uncharacterized protein